MLRRLRLNFVKSKTKDTVFAGQDKLKLVTHCHDSDRAQANILQEYSAYKMFSVISDVGYKVRLVQVSYSDTGRAPEERLHCPLWVLDRIGI